MAATAINLVSTNDVNTASAGFTLTAGTIADGFKVEMGGKDYKTTFIAHSTGASDVTLTVAVVVKSKSRTGTSCYHSTGR